MRMSLKKCIREINGNKLYLKTKFPDKMGKTLIGLFLELGNFDGIRTRAVCTSEFIGQYASLKCNNGVGWARVDGVFGKKYKVLLVASNGNQKFSPAWERTNDEDNEIEKDIQSLPKSSGNSISMIKIYGTLTGNLSSRYIRKDIRASLKGLTCVFCPVKSVEIDHKNGLYNDDRVLNSKTQCIDDFQPICKHCNDLKRQIVKTMKETGKRPPATSIPSLKSYGIDFTTGNEHFDPKDVNAMVGMYWYDPVKFHQDLIKIFTCC